MDTKESPIECNIENAMQASRQAAEASQDKEGANTIADKNDDQKTNNAQPPPNQDISFGNEIEMDGYNSDSSLSSNSSGPSIININNNNSNDQLVYSDEEGEEPYKESDFITKHEISDPTIPEILLKEFPPEAKLEPLGRIHSIVEKIVVIERDAGADNSRILNEGTLVAFEDRHVLGAVFEVFGPIVRPLFSIRFNSADEIDREKCFIGRKMFFTMDQAQYLMVNQIQMIRATDASNHCDEEIGEDEMEFSDDEQEAQYKKMMKQKRRLEAHQKQLAKQQKQLEAAGSIGNTANAQQQGGNIISPGSLPTTVNANDAMGQQPQQSLPPQKQQQKQGTDILQKWGTGESGGRSLINYSELYEEDYGF
ncbi:hypothetical protein H4219_001374 [Mycoemilia scoparia]|uniref:H/ACA ribonucleoprotein complex non-core subunit NAF1 n=1 Tax=Mycoemilia scoparia TaxID=417184 RepID=A0A9W8A9R5_9FUNG|nr:hypothetical protein H4219_001374 [Mycoemilia scoparia]